jgi:hypothetical protein
LSAGVDDETWMHHLRAGDYSQWFREAIKDERLAAAAEKLEQSDSATAAEGRELFEAAITAEYTLPARAV